MSRYNFEAEMSEIIALGIGVEDGGKFLFWLLVFAFGCLRIKDGFGLEWNSSFLVSSLNCSTISKCEGLAH